MKLSPLRKRVLAAAATLVFVGVAVVLGLRNAEPKVNGRPLSALLDDLHSTNSAVRKNATEALRAMGPEAVADLTNDLMAAPVFEGWRAKARQNLPTPVRKAIGRVARLRGAQDARVTAASALKHIGPGASNAIPALIESLPNTSYEGIMALTSIGEAAVPALREALKGESEDRRVYAMQALSNLGADATTAIPDLVAVLSSPSRMTAGSAAAALTKIGEPAVPALTNALLTLTNQIGRTQAAMALWQIGAAAKPATNALVLATRDPSADVRLHALIALVNIFRDETYLTPVLVERLRDEEPLVRKLAVQSLGLWENSFRANAKEVEPLTRDADEEVRKVATGLYRLHTSP